jgi:hypothetical protein
MTGETKSGAQRARPLRPRCIEAVGPLIRVAIYLGGRDSVASFATRYRMAGSEFGPRAGGGGRYSVPVQTQFEAHSVPYNTGTWSFTRVETARAWC